jgi:hypothetical protein
MHALFSRVPAVVWTGILAFVLTVSAGAVWTVLLISNVATSPAISWAVAVMALLLWLMWQYLGGTWRPQSTSEARRLYLRARPLSGQVFALALVAGWLSIVALVGFWIVLHQLVKIPARVLPNFSGYPLFTVVLVLVMSSLVSSLAEEAGFRGLLPGRSGTKLPRADRNRNYVPGDCARARSDAGFCVVHTAMVLLCRCDVRNDDFSHQVDSAEHAGAQHWPSDLLHPGVAI